MEKGKALEVANEVIALYTNYGDEDYIGEPVSQLEHMSQAAQLAMDAGYDNEVVLAAFFHDIGHFCEHVIPVQQMDGYGTVDHEKLGAEFLLSKGFSARIARLVQSHVEAKRYLTFRYPDYYAQLSEASKKTLAFQGGIMNADEASAFEAEKDFELFIQLRRWDEEAKLENMPVVDFDVIRQMIVAHLTAGN